MATTLLFMMFVLTLCAVLAMLSTRERFNLPELIYRVDLKDNMLNIFMTQDQPSAKIRAVLKKTRNIALTQSYNNAQAYITDVYTCLSDNPQQQGIVMLPEQKHLVFIKSKDKVSDESLVQYLARVSKPQIIGLTENAVRLAKTLLMSTKGDEGKGVDGIAFTTSRDAMVDARTEDACYVLFDTVPNLIKQVPEGIKIDLLKTEDYDIHKLKVMVPYARFDVIDAKQLWGTRVEDEFPIKTSMVIDMVMCTTYFDRFNYERYSYQIGQLLENLNTFDVINYYTQYIDFVKPTMHYLGRFNKYVQNRDELQILEQFKDQGVVAVKPSNNVIGFYDASKKTFTVLGTSIDGIFLKNDYTVSLVAQQRPEENGEYTVESVDERNKEVRLRRLGGDSGVDDGGEDKHFDPRYVCYGDPYVVNKELCNSKFDEIGDLKVKRTYWDRPCKNNNECPFYQSNTNYRNYRGGCVDGYCELPLGINRLSFREHDNTSRPLCHGCKQNAPYCCELQKNRDLYPHLSSPDYAFELDQDERRAALMTKWP